LCHDLIDSGLPLYTVSVSKDRPTRIWSVLAQVAGVQAVVEEVVEAANALCKKKPKRLVGEKDSALWRRMTSQFYAREGEPVVQLVAASTVLARIAPELAASGDLELRPFSGRLLIRGAEMDTVFEIAAKFADSSAPIVVAGENDRYNYVVRRSPDGAADQVRSQLQARVKARFDPGGVLNPFALL
jgi:hypothetical protein